MIWLYLAAVGLAAAGICHYYRKADPQAWRDQYDTHVQEQLAARRARREGGDDER